MDTTIMNKHLNTLAIVGLMALALPARAQSGAEFVGHYGGGGVDSVSELLVLPNQTFCFALMAGNLDLMVGGRWQVVAGESGNKGNKGASAIRLTEVRPSRAPFLMQAQQREDADKVPAGQRVVMFGGRGFSRADGVFIGFSLDDLRPVFAPQHRRFQSRYSIVIPKGATRLYVGLPSAKEGETPTTAKALEYAIGDTRFNTIGLGYDHDAARPLYDFVGTLDGKKLRLQSDQGGSALTRRDGAISANMRQSAEEKCINPALGKGGARAEQDLGLTPALRTVDVPWPLAKRPSWIALDK